MPADYDVFLERQRAARYDGGEEDDPRDGEEDEREDESGERADEVARMYSEGHERRAVREMQSEASERALKSYMEEL